MSRYHLIERPLLNSPVLIARLEGFIDAGAGARLAAKHLRKSFSFKQLATIDADEFVVYRLRRPPLSIRDGVHVGPRFFSYDLSYASAPGADLILLEGPEPDLNWKAFGETIAEISSLMGVKTFIGLGAFPAPAPHTRPIKVAATSPSQEMVATVGFIRGVIEVPGSAQGHLEAVMDALGVRSVGLWARVPHYVANIEYPLAAAALLEEVRKLTGLEIDLTELYTAGLSVNEQLDKSVASNEQHRKLVELLEMGVDAAEGNPLNITGNVSDQDISAEIERFLKSLESGSEG